MRPPIARAVVVVVTFVVTVLSLGTTPALAQQLERSRRLERQFDFEETDDRGNKIGFSGSVLPRHWYIVGRSPQGADERFLEMPLHQALTDAPGYPDFAEVGYDRNHSVSGDFSLKLELTGGGTGAYVEVGAIPAIAESDYLLTAWVRTEALEHAWAEVRVYFIDHTRSRVASSVQRSEPIQTDGRWEQIAIRLPGDFEGAEYIGAELLIVQPGMSPTHPLGARQVVEQDIDGGAWFDDIALWKLPHVELRTQRRTNIIAGESPEITATVRDLSGQRLRARLTVYDYRYDIVDQQTSVVGAGALSSWTWRPELPGYGWYFTELLVSEDDGTGAYRNTVEHTIGAMLYLPEDPGHLGRDLSRFMLVAEGMPNEQLPLLEEILAQTGQSGAVLSAWDRDTTPQTVVERQALLDPIIRALTVGGGRAVVSLHPVPVELAGLGVSGSTDPLSVLLGEEAHWLPYLKPVLVRHGQRISRWQIGSASRADAFYSGRLAGDLDAVEDELDRMAPSPVLVVPWRLDQPARGTVQARQRAVAMAWPQGVTPGVLAQAMDTWPVPPERVRLDLELARADQMPHEQRVTDLVLRMIHAWEQQPGAIGLPSPWTPGEERKTSLLPDPALGAWVTTARRLAGQRVVGHMPIGYGLRCMVLDGEQGGTLVVWNENADADTVEVNLYLGQNPQRIDLWGNRTALTNVAGKHTLSVGRTPEFITGIDATLARFRAGFTLDDPFIESTQTVHRRTLRITNPWPRTINGGYTLTGPAGWTIDPRMHRFSIPPGGSIEVPLAIRFPIHESGGIKPLTARFSFDADRSYDIVMQTPIELGLRDVQFEASVALEPGQTPGTTDAVVTLSATNRGDEATALYLFASMRDRPRRELLIPGIDPGEFVTRRVRFTDVGGLLGDTPLRCGVREANGPAVLNQLLELDVQP
ncbi:MAG: hypothetical protein ACIAXF_01320 [Phycisphaerales bacterium JB063]